MVKHITVIGGGMGGYSAAVRAAQLGAEVTLIEKDVLGGTCLNRGCIPTKALLESANVLSLIKNAQIFGVTVSEISLDFNTVLKRKDAIVSKLLGGIVTLMKKNRIKVVKGTGTLIDLNVVSVIESKEIFESDAVILATGSRPSMLSVEGISASNAITSDQALTLPRLPASILVVGAGSVGLEFAQIFNKMGSKVTICEAMPEILPREDTEVAGVLRKTLEKEGIGIFTEAPLTRVKVNRNGETRICFATKSGEQERTAEKVLVATGREPCVKNLGLENLGVKMDQGKVVVNAKMETTIAGVYAVGDVTGGMMLAHAAMSEGICAAENALGLSSRIDYNNIPRCIYTHPEVASVGLGEEHARQQSSDINITKFPFMANGRALTINETEGFVKIVSTKHGEILGTTIVGPEATELIAEVALAMHVEATLEDIASCTHAHPTLCEVIREGAMRAEGRAIHI